MICYQNASSGRFLEKRRKEAGEKRRLANHSSLEAGLDKHSSLEAVFEQAQLFGSCAVWTDTVPWKLYFGQKSLLHGVAVSSHMLVSNETSI